MYFASSAFFAGGGGLYTWVNVVGGLEWGEEEKILLRAAGLVAWHQKYVMDVVLPWMRRFLNKKGVRRI